MRCYSSYTLFSKFAGPGRRKRIRGGRNREGKRGHAVPFTFSSLGRCCRAGWAGSRRIRPACLLT